MFIKTAIILLTSLFIFTSSQFVYSQTENSQTESSIDDSGEAQFYETGILRSDYALADVVVQIDVEERHLEDSIGSGDCETNKGAGYCLYRLKGEIKQVFKGKNLGKTLEFYISPDTAYPKEYLMGEKVVFLIRNRRQNNNTQSFSTIENSTRQVKFNIVETMRKIVDPNTVIDDTDEDEPYSLVSLRKEFSDADAVIYVNVTNFKPLAGTSRLTATISEAQVKKVFKGKLKIGQTIEYKTDLLYRPLRQEELGERVIFLKRQSDDNKTLYESMNYTNSVIQYNILKKLGVIASEKSNKKN